MGSIQITKLELQFYFFRLPTFWKKYLCAMKYLHMEKEEGQESMENPQAG